MDWMNLYFQMKAFEYLIGYVILGVLLVGYGAYKFLEWRDARKH